MSEKKNIDKLFKERLKDFEVAPSDAVWERIEHELHGEKRKKRRVIPIWWQIAGVAAVLALLFTVGNIVLDGDNKTSPDTEIVDTEKLDTKSSEAFDSTTKPSDTNKTENNSNSSVVKQDTSEETSKNTGQEDVTTSEASKQNNSVATSKDHTNQNTNTKEDYKKSAVIKNKSQSENAVANRDDAKLPKDKKDITTNNNSKKNAVANQSNEVKSNNDPNQKNNPEDLKKEASEMDKLIKSAQKSDHTKVATTTNSSEKETSISAVDSSKIDILLKEENAIEKAIADAEKDKDSTQEVIAPIKRWTVAPNVAPVYFNTLGKGSPLDDQFTDNAKEGDITMSYGVKGSYAISEKLKIRAGVNKVDLGYSTNNILVFDGTSSSGARMQMQNVKFHDSLNTNAYVSADNFSFTTGPQILFTKEQGSIDQQLGFIEVPIELEYSLIDKKFGLNLIGGFSTLFLSNNEVYSVQSNGDRTLLGEATNINDMSYSANFGIGVNYNISKQLRFNLEPTFKYQINTFNETSGDFQPFFIGVYTGLSFKF